MARRRRAVILRPTTWQIIKRIIRDYLAGRLTNRVPRADQPLGGRARRIRYGKVAPAAGFAQGALTAPDNEVTEWTGLKSGTPAATTKTIECHWSTGTFEQDDAVAVTTFADGSKVVSCFPGGL